MSRSTLKHVSLALAVSAGLAVALPACGSADEESATAAPASTAAATTGAGAADVEAAKAAVAPYIGKPSEFPVTEKLAERPEGASLAFMNGGTPVGSLLWQMMQPAGEMLGLKLQQFKAGPASNVTNAGFDAAIATKPDAMVVAGINVDLWASKIPQLREQGTTIVASAIRDGAKHGLDPVPAGEADDDRSGELMAAYVIAEMNPEANVALYDIAELPLSRRVGEAFSAELKRLCPDCSVRTTHIPAATIGNTAPNAVVSDLQANPDANVAVFTSDEIQHGLPEALSKAGIEIQTLGFAPDPTNLQYLKEGKETAVLAYDLPITAWMMVDQAARQMTGQEITGPEAKGYGVIQFLRPEDVTFDPSRGWTGYPDFAERFAELWGVQG